VYSIEEKKKKYHDKISTIINSGNIETINLKFADMSDNFSEERLNQLSSEERKKLINIEMSF